VPRPIRARRQNSLRSVPCRPRSGPGLPKRSWDRPPFAFGEDRDPRSGGPLPSLGSGRFALGSAQRPLHRGLDAKSRWWTGWLQRFHSERSDARESRWRVAGAPPCGAPRARRVAGMRRAGARVRRGVLGGPTPFVDKPPEQAFPRAEPGGAEAIRHRRCVASRARHPQAPRLRRASPTAKTRPPCRLTAGACIP
jgi:hypothetical protein